MLAGSFGFGNGAVLVFAQDKRRALADIDERLIVSNSGASTCCELVQETVAHVNGEKVQNAAWGGRAEALQMTGWCRENEQRAEEGRTEEQNEGELEKHMILKEIP